MKVICPECSSHYDVPVPLLGEPGRRVRCANCGHIWIAEIRDESGDSGLGAFGGFNDNLDIEPIPMSVHPEDGEALSHGAGGPGLNFGYLGRLAAGFGLACLLIAVFLGIGVAAGLNEGALRPLFAPFGLASGTSKVSPLVIQDVMAVAAEDAAGQPVLKVTGKIHNGSDHEADVPQLEVTLLSESGAEGDSVQIKPEQESLDGGETLEFSGDLPGGASKTDRVRVQFIP